MADSVKLTQLDSNEIPRYTYSEDNRAIRVEVINGGRDSNWKSIDYSPMPVQKIEAPEIKIERIEVPVIVKEVQIVEVPQIIIKKELEFVQVQQIVKEIEYKEIEKTIVVTEYKTIEVPIVIKEKEIVYIDKLNYKMFYIMQAITLALIIASKLIK